MESTTNKRLAEVWGDTVVLKELFFSSILGITLTMLGYILGSKFFSGIETLEPGLVKGYALMIGIIGCVLSGILSAKLFKPKRIVEEKFEQENIEDVIKSGGMTLEEEILALSTVDKQILDEMEELNLTALLELRSKTDNENKEKGGI
ncbi:hypothetical protein [Clostridiisalibacter paucivorans]|uniref:hypothetical protein n=1 Tax=Clostridiisalibacter paucivorans TaxID=408753 RepID=UPI00047EF774|nr:hypothetical protein [Clostridiisalibacter paucivorans]